mgnify:CR=1 FL=1
MAKKILVVDDEPDFLMMASLRLKKSGYDVVTATDGEKALNKLKETAPDLVLLDVKMPKLNGYEVFERMQKDQGLSKIPVIFSSADTSVDLETKTTSLKAAGYLKKPFDGPTMLDMIMKHLTKTLP